MSSIEERLNNIEKRLELIESKLNISHEQTQIKEQEIKSESKLEQKEIKIKEKSEKPKTIHKLTFTQIITFLGITGIVIGLISFYTYAVMHEWIGKTGQIMIGILTGYLLFYISYLLRNKHETWSNIVFGGAYFIEYLSIYYGVTEYRVLPQALGLLLALIVLISSSLLSTKLNSRLIAYFSLAGGSIIPYIVDYSNSVLFSMSYYALLGLGITLISLKKNWSDLRFVSYVLLFIYSWSSIFKYPYISNFKTHTFVYLFTIFFIYNISSIINSLKNKDLKPLDIIILISLPLFVIHPIDKVFHLSNTTLGFFTLLFSFIYFIEITLIKATNYTLNNSLKYTLVSVAIATMNIGIITLISSGPLKYYYVLIFAIQWFTLSIISKKIEEPNSKYYSILSYIFLYLTFIFVLNETTKTSYIYSEFVNSYIMHTTRELALQHIGQVLIHHTILLIINILIAVGMYILYKKYNSKVNGGTLLIYTYYLIYNILDILEYLTQLITQSKVHQTFSIILSLAWLIYSLTLYDKSQKTGGFVKAVAIILLIITLLKIALIDLWSLHGIYRIIGFIIFGILLLAGGYRYGKAKE